MEKNWFLKATDRLVQRIVSGENYIKVVDSIAKEYADIAVPLLKCSEYEAFTWGKDALLHRVWQLKLIEQDVSLKEYNDVTISDDVTWVDEDGKEHTGMIKAEYGNKVAVMSNDGKLVYLTKKQLDMEESLSIESTVVLESAMEKYTKYSHKFKNKTSLIEKIIEKMEMLPNEADLFKNMIISEGTWKPKSDHKSKSGGLTQKGRDDYNKKFGANLKPPVTSDNPSESERKRRKNFCDRSKGQKDKFDIDCRETPEKRICLARKRWKC
jgi:hypothetical protein